MKKIAFVINRIKFIHKFHHKKRNIIIIEVAMLHLVDDEMTVNDHIIR